MQQPNDGQHNVMRVVYECRVDCVVTILQFSEHNLVASTSDYMQFVLGILSQICRNSNNYHYVSSYFLYTTVFQGKEQSLFLDYIK